MTNRSDGPNFPTTGRPPDRNWMDTKCIRPTWMGNEARNTVDSGIEFTEKKGMDRYRSSQGDGSVTRMMIRYGERMQTFRKIQVICRGMVHIKGYCSSRKTQRALYQEVRRRKPDRDGPRMTCAQIRLNTGGHSTTETMRDYGY